MDELEETPKGAAAVSIAGKPLLIDESSVAPAGLQDNLISMDQARSDERMLSTLRNTDQSYEALHGFTNQLGFGFGNMALQGAYELMDPEKAEAHKQYLKAQDRFGTSITHDIGSIAGFAAAAGLAPEAEVAQPLARVLPVAGNKLVAGALNMAANGAWMGALQGAGHAGEQLIIHDRPVTAEALALGAGEGALFGGAAGGALGFAAAGIGRGIEAAASRTEGGLLQRYVMKSLGADKEAMSKVASEYGTKNFLTSLDEIASKGGFKPLAKDAEEGFARAANSYKGISEVAQKKIVDSAPPGTWADLSRRATQRIKDEVLPVVPNAQVGADVGKVLKILSREPTGSSLLGIAREFKSGFELVDDKMASILKGEVTTSFKSFAPEPLFESWRGAYINREISEAGARLARNRIKNLASDSPIGIDTMARMAGGAAIFGGPAALTWGVSRFAGRALIEGQALKGLAFRLAANSEVGSISNAVSSKVAEGASKFVRNGVSAGGAYVAGKFTKARLDRELDNVSRLTSESHRQAVVHYAQAVSGGDDRFAAEIVKVYDNAASVARAAVPPSGDMGMRAPVKMSGLKPSEVKFLRIMDILHDPMGAIDKFVKGTLSRDEALTLRTIAPETHKKLVDHVKGEVIERQKKGKGMSVSQITQLGILVDGAVDPILESDFVKMIQDSFAPVAPEQAPQQGGHSDPLFDPGMQTATERVQKL